MIRMAVLPYSRAGIVGASMLGLGRAIGETIADLEAAPQIESRHIAEAIQYRTLDRTYWA